jgi:hypothetical protein
VAARAQASAGFRLSRAVSAGMLYAALEAEHQIWARWGDASLSYRIIAAQWWQENGPAWPPTDNNPGNIEGGPWFGAVGIEQGREMGVDIYATPADGVRAYVLNITGPLYESIHAAARSQDPLAIMHAIGLSPWAGSHYGSPAGVNLVRNFTAIVLGES